jgi:hypothetical protein
MTAQTRSPVGQATFLRNAIGHLDGQEKFRATSKSPACPDHRRKQPRRFRAARHYAL